MLSHITVGCHDLERSAAFYDAVLLPLGLVRRPVTPDGGPAAACWIGPSQTLPRFYVYRPFDNGAASSGNGSMVAFLAATPAAVDAAYAAGLAAGGHSEGDVGPRPRYGDGYYGGYLRDPAGNKVHIVHRGDIEHGGLLQTATRNGVEAHCPPAPVRPETVDHLKAINARFIHNFITNDVASHDALLHRDFIYIRGNGTRVDRASYLSEWGSGFDPEVIPYWDTRDESITLVGNVALVRATNKHVIMHNGCEETGMSTYTDTYIFEEGRWQCVQAQITPVTLDAEPVDDTVVSIYLKGVKQSPSV